MASLQAEAKQLLAEYTQIDLAQVRGKTQNTLKISALCAFSSIKQKAIIRLCLRQLQWRMPSAIKLQHILSDVLYAQQDATPCVQWDTVEIRRYRGYLYIMPRLSPHNPQQIIAWHNIHVDLWIDSLQQAVSAQILRPLLQQYPAGQVTVRFRQGGERLWLQGHKSPTALKKLFYNADYPYWERDRIPLIYLNNSLIMVYPHWSAKI